ncbi:MAG: hypothetical protein MMC33_004631 [Icmadophila ericetorum]|nr:hypothetical protein [Icmadophila ericetorum]
MDRCALDQRLYRVHANGASYLQPDRSAVHLGHRDDLNTQAHDPLRLHALPPTTRHDQIPYLDVGVIADESKSKWGRRRPFMVSGSILVALCLFALGWTREIVEYFLGNSSAKASWTIFLAVLSIYGVDFAINAVQASCRSLIVDTLPVSKQQLGSAWASRMAAIGHLVGYAIGTLDLPKLLGPGFGDTQFKQLIVIAAIALLVAIGITSYAVEERVLISPRESDTTSGVKDTLSKIFKTTMHLPNRIQGICWVQFWAWIGWFPFLFYSPTWVGEIYLRYSSPQSAPNSGDTLGEMGRIGSLSLVVFSVVQFTGSILLPWVVRSPADEKPGFTPRPPTSIAPIITPLIETLNKIKPDLITAWMFSHLIFAAAMLLAPLVQSLHFATILVAICGVPWAIACWAPFAFMGVEINRLSTSPLDPAPSPRQSSYPLLSTTPASPTLPSNRSSSADRENSGSGETAGIYLGILNLFTTLPQFVGTFISMIVFSIFEPDEHELHTGETAGSGNTVGSVEGEKAEAKEGLNAIAICLFIGAICAIGASYATRSLKHMR